jgi:hypothetical protein
MASIECIFDTSLVCDERYLYINRQIVKSRCLTSRGLFASYAGHLPYYVGSGMIVGRDVISLYFTALFAFDFHCRGVALGLVCEAIHTSELGNIESLLPSFVPGSPYL